jgi:hypothetical protein
MLPEQGDIALFPRRDALWVPHDPIKGKYLVPHCLDDTILSDL